MGALDDRWHRGGTKLVWTSDPGTDSHFRDLYAYGSVGRPRRQSCSSKPTMGSTVGSLDERRDARRKHDVADLLQVLKGLLQRS